MRFEPYPLRPVKLGPFKLGRGALIALASVALTLTLAAPPADAQWVWRDSAGRINASDRPPPREVPDKDIMQRPAEARRAQINAPANPPATAPAAPAASSAQPQQTALDKEVQARKKAAEAEQAAKTAAEEEKAKARRADNCRAARSNLATLESGVRIARSNEKGEREFLEDAQRAEEMRRAREVVASDCR